MFHSPRNQTESHKVFPFIKLVDNSGCTDTPLRELERQCLTELIDICHQRVIITTVKILKFGTPQTIAIIVVKIENFDITLH